MNLMQTITIGKYCSHKGCRKVGRYAMKLSDFWVTVCEDHHGERITLDFSKIPSQTNDPRLVQ